MDQYELIRTANRVYGKGIRAIAREYGHSRKTIRKALNGLEPQYRRKQQAKAPVMDPVSGIVESWLKEDRDRPRKQRHTARRVFTRLVAEHGFQGSEVTVRRWVRACKARWGLGPVQAVIPLDPEVAREAEVDWGRAWARIDGQQQAVKIFCMRSRFSGKAFVCAYPWERQEMFFDGHIRAFAFYGGVFPVVVYDNLSQAVRIILRGKRRVEQERFSSFRSYYTFEARFCNPSMGREKGGVEGLVGYARRNFLVPMPEVKDFTELNALLLERCMAHGERVIAGREDRRTIEHRHTTEKPRLLVLPPRPYDNSKPVRVRISNYQTAQIDRNRYSVPTAYVGRWLWAHVGCDKVGFYAEQRKVAEHPRLFGNSKWQIDPQHYLELVAERPQAFDSARPIRQWRPRWPREYETMLDILRRRQGQGKGTRDFVHILQLHQDHPGHQVERAVAEAIECHGYSYESVRHLLLARDECREETPPLEPGLIPGITDRVVAGSDISRYDALLQGGGR